MTTAKFNVWGDLGQFFKGSWLNVLLVFIPISLILRFIGGSDVLVFATAGLAIVPLAGLISVATEVATEHTGPGLGGFLNATFGNATELIIAMFALFNGLYGVVKASITGSILGNMLLVLGFAMIAGGWNREKQHFNRTAAGASISMLILAMTALIMPAVWDQVVIGRIGAPNPTVTTLSLWTAIILLITYVGSLVFSLITHKRLFTSTAPEEGPHTKYHLSSAIVLLTIATVLTAVEAEVLVSAVEPAAAALGMTELFVGVIIVAVIGNAAEHFTAIVAAARNHMDLSFNIAIGSSTQIALLVAPVLVLVSFLRPQPMDLVFNQFEIIALVLAVAVVGVVSLDGESNWFEGLQLLAVYIVLGLAFYFVPA